MILPALSSISLQDITFLIENKVVENNYLEYKKEFSNKDSSKVKLLAEICAFANSSGGDLIYGVEENSDGIPTKIVGLEIQSIDHEIQRINNILRTGLDPRLPSYDIKSIEVRNHKYLIIIRVQKSWNSPHRVVPNSQFYGRNSSGKYPLDVGEIRNKIFQSSSLNEKIRNFRTNRIIKISSNETQQPMNEGAKLIMHMLPISSFSNESVISISKSRRTLEKFWPLSATGMNYRINLDGNICYTGGLREKCSSYTQVYRSGTVESCLSLNKHDPSNKSIYMPIIQNSLIERTYEYLKLLTEMDISYPIVVYISFTGIEGFTLDLKHHGTDENHPSKENIILLPEVLLGNDDANIKGLYKPAFDVMYNAFGLSESINYDANENIIRG